MRRLFILLFFVPAAFAQNGIDSNKWYSVDNNFAATSCIFSSQSGAYSGVMKMTAEHGTYSCQNQTSSYKTGTIISAPFFFTYGKVVIVARFPPLGVHSTLWLWGGAPGTSGYPPNCVASIRAGGFLMNSCMTDTSNAYEIDFAEYMPGLRGATTITNNLHTWVKVATTYNSNNNYNAGIDLSLAYHSYELDWLPGSMVFKIDGVTSNTLTPPGGQYDQPSLLLISQQIDSTGGTSNSYPLYTYVQSVQIWDQSNNLIFSDFFPGMGGAFWFGIP